MTNKMQTMTSEAQAATNEAQVLIDTDWGEEWVRIQRARKHVDSSDRWDKRAPSFGSTRVRSPYMEQFIKLLGLQEGETAFDMGCGNGAITVPLAQAGFHVIARDFSQGMLAALEKEAQSAGVIDKIDFARMSWEDDWEAHGINEGMCDIAFASRSVITQDLAAALEKLSRVAKRRAAVTVSTGYTPKMSPTILKELGITRVAAYDYVYTFNILCQLGYSPEVTYITHDRKFSFDTYEEGVANFEGLIEHAQTYCSSAELEEARKRLPEWVRKYAEENESAGTIDRHGELEGAYKIVLPNDVKWAFVAWNTGM